MSNKTLTAEGTPFRENHHALLEALERVKVVTNLPPHDIEDLGHHSQLSSSFSIVNMIRRLCLIILALGTCSPVLNMDIDQLNKTDNHRRGKVISLFSVVTFGNVACQSSLTYTTNTIGGVSVQRTRNGTCFTESECSSLGGNAQGACASGFGVCCVFLISDQALDITQNCTYIQNPNTPLVYTSTSSLQYTIRKSQDSVCQLRLDFESFALRGTDTQSEATGGTCLDQFVVTTSNNFPVPTICGQNQGQHIYVDLGQANTATADLDFSFTGESTIRNWDIKVTQIPCGNTAAPNGCLQYHFGLSGRLTSFNFNPTNDNHLASQNYNVCIDQEDGFCCVEYTQCTDTDSFSLSTGTSTIDTAQQKVLFGSLCSLDFVIIEGSSGACNMGTGGVSNNRYCGSFLGSTAMATTGSPICDCTSPFQVGIRTDELADGSAAINSKASRGEFQALVFHFLANKLNCLFLFI
ncbi:uncharacterized protein LOC131881118 isoform X2 [Tigriopus californicus]|uniref:uncharacterized protein LOC131881118 isoform X2 n=1 Tax=Tigriopus californicus TaxID=6832 RepID=UPI0027DA5028|nr:uncharacterized protein LOC131881118 isoform X2 [Tigriopus californicus]